MTQRLAPDAAAVARFRSDLVAVFPNADENGADAKLLVAVSGGADSMALLLLAHAALGENCLAATVDHGIRSEAAEEAALVATACRRLGVHHATLTAPLPARVRRTANLSARARAMRYRLLEAHMAEVGAVRLATAHHADDQIETLIMRLNRGAGVAGLSGIRARGGQIVRPLLGWRRAELSAVVASCGVDAVDDPSNVDDRFDRARLRKELAGAGWLDPAMWGRSATALGDAEEALAWAVRREASVRCEVDPHGVSLLFGEERLPWEIARRLFLHCLRLVNPAAEPRGGELTRLVQVMLASAFRADLRGACATLAGVRVETMRSPRLGITYRFRPAPPPRTN